MQKIALITDSACDLDLNTLKENKNILDKIAMELIDQETLEEYAIYEIIGKNYR